MSEVWKPVGGTVYEVSSIQVQEIRQRYAAGGASLETLHRLYGVSRRAVGRLVRGETYANV